MDSQSPDGARREKSRSIVAIFQTIYPKFEKPTMSDLLLKSKTDEQIWYGAPDHEGAKLFASSLGSDAIIVDVSTAEVIHDLFLHHETNGGELYAHPKTNPKQPPEERFKRHRNYYIYQLNEFRHWWKTSRLLVRLSGGYEYCLLQANWIAMGAFRVSKHKHAKRAFKSMKAIGRGGPSRDFLKNVKKFTRTIRIILAFARGWEARLDNRFVEVLWAEAL